MRVWSRRRTLVLVGSVLLAGYIAVCCVAAGWNRWSELLALERSSQYEKQHPADLPGCLAAEAIVAASGARDCSVHLVEATAAGFAEGVATPGDYSEGRRVPVQGMEWGRRFLTQVALWGSRPRGQIADFHPSFAVRFVGAQDTTYFLVDLTPRERRGSRSGPSAVIEAHWRQAGRSLSQRGWAPCQLEPGANAESVIARPELLAPSFLID